MYVGAAFLHSHERIMYLLTILMSITDFAALNLTWETNNLNQPWLHLSGHYMGHCSMCLYFCLFYAHRRTYGTLFMNQVESVCFVLMWGQRSIWFKIKIKENRKSSVYSTAYSMCVQYFSHWHINIFHKHTVWTVAATHFSLRFHCWNLKHFV